MTTPRQLQRGFEPREPDPDDVNMMRLSAFVRGGGLLAEEEEDDREDLDSLDREQVAAEVSRLRTGSASIPPVRASAVLASPQLWGCAEPIAGHASSRGRSSCALRQPSIA